MSTKYEPEQFEVRIFDLEDGEHFVDLETLTHVLQGIQKAIFVLAKNELKEPLARLSAKTKKSFAIRCSIPRPGSYVMPIAFGQHDSHLLEDSLSKSVGHVAEKLFECFSALETGIDNVFKTIAESSGRKQLFTAFRGMIPKSGAKWKLGISGRRLQKEIQYTTKTIQTLKRFQESILLQDETSLQTVTGYLIKMDFDRKSITLKYPPTNTELECYYNDELEDELSLFENRRELLQVTGNVTYKNDCVTPKKIARVESIQFLDVSELFLESFVVDDQELAFKEPLILTPELVESCQFITLRDEQLGIDVIAQTREELEEELRAELTMLWKQSQMPDTELGKVFQEHKKNLLMAIKEV